MREEWIEDIIAVLECGSLARAAERRNVTQSAFTRRVRLIEDAVGAELFDRGRKPVFLKPVVAALEPELRETAARLHGLRRTLKTVAGRTGGSFSFVCQHAITTTVSPWIVRILTSGEETSVKVRSANQDECLLRLLSGEVDFAVMYGLSEEPTSRAARAFEAVQIGRDLLIPVCAPSLNLIATGNTIPAITYPSDVFLGEVFDRMIVPRLPSKTDLSAKAETALTLAAYQFALGGIGAAWLPRSMVITSLEAGTLMRLPDRFPTQMLEIRMVRLAEGQTAQSDMVWHDVLTNLDLPQPLQCAPDDAADID